MAELLEYRQVFDVAMIVLGVIVFLLLLRPFLTWYFKVDHLIAAMNQAAEAHKDSHKQMAKLIKACEKMATVKPDFSAQAHRGPRLAPSAAVEKVAPPEPTPSEPTAQASPAKVIAEKPVQAAPETKSAATTKPAALKTSQSSPTPTAKPSDTAKETTKKPSYTNDELGRKEPTLNFDEI